MTYQASKQSLNTMVLELDKTTGKLTYVAHFTETHTNRVVQTSIRISLSALHVASKETVYK